MTKLDRVIVFKELLDTANIPCQHIAMNLCGQCVADIVHEVGLPVIPSGFIIIAGMHVHVTYPGSCLICSSPEQMQERQYSLPYTRLH